MTRKSTEVRKEEIKLAVLQIIRTEGIKSVSTKNLAKYTGLSEGAIFRHFKSKRDIIISIIDDVATNMLGNLKQIAENKKIPDKRLLEFLCSNITYLTEHKGITILLFTEASHSNDTEMIEKLNHIFNYQRQLVSGIISDGIEMGIWDKNISIEDVTQFYMGIPTTYSINLVLTREDPRSNEFCSRMILLIERMLKEV